MKRISIEEYKRMTAKPETGRKTSEEWRNAYRSTQPAPVQTEPERVAQRALFERHDTPTIRIRMPLAPTANNTKAIRVIPGKPPFLVPSTQYNAYKEVVAEFWTDHWKGARPMPLTGRLRVLAIVHMTRNGGDIANREKALCDAMTECGVWLDDSQIDDVRLIRGEVIPGVGAMDVIIETITNGPSVSGPY